MSKTDTYTSETIDQTFSYGIIYCYSIPGEQHAGRLKIGSATVVSANPTQADIEAAARERIHQQTKTADVSTVLEFAELALTANNEFFSDFAVHEVLMRSGFERVSENVRNQRSEWFKIDVQTARSAVNAVKTGRRSLSAEQVVRDQVESFPFRPNQLDAIERTTRAIKSGRKHFLWNAKMRFGKTSAAMQVAKQNEMQKVLIVTHRPSVKADWRDDFRKVLSGHCYQYSSREYGEDIKTHLHNNTPFVYFASLQDLRLSKFVVEDEAAKSKARGFDKNDEVFSTVWDMMIVDEAHEGTTSNLGDVTLSKIPNNFTLELSGTPFNILHKREESEVYTWDYVMEQEQKLSWDERNLGVPNPYAELPALKMFTYDVDNFASYIGDLGSFNDELDGAFKFHEFFRVHKDENGLDRPEFIHEAMVRRFVDLLADETQNTKFPYATEAYRNHNKHSLWLLPNRIKVIEAMEKILKDHPIFGKFGIVNISGNAKDDDEADTDAKTRVMSAINKNDYTITLTGQRLTTGASIREWTAVLMMSDTASATTYLQTAFRCQTPATIDGKLKTQGYVFDFAPDRTLRLVAEAIELNHKSGKTNTPEQREAMQKFLNFCPILAARGGRMEPYDVKTMLGELKKAIVERVSRNGFDDPKLYNDELLQLDELAQQQFNDLRAIVGASNTERTKDIIINNLGMDNLAVEQAEQVERTKKKKSELTEEQKERLRKLKEAREQKKTAITILRAVSIRMPMLVYGANVSVREDITLAKFLDLVDDESWAEFMPKGLTKDRFRDFTKYYDEDVFRGVAHNIRAKAFDYDSLPPTERIIGVTEVFSTFKNPDKETVLTPWSVVNMHLSSTLGGHNFEGDFDQKSGRPQWVGGELSRIWSDEQSSVLEINSKSGLYPLLAAYNFYSRKLVHQKQPEDKVHGKLWREVLADNIFVICKSPMAATITRRTLAGYNQNIKVNVVYIKDLISKLRGEGNYKGYNIASELQEVFKKEGKEVKFTAVVGNPPYQVNTDTNFATPVYHLFFDAAVALKPDYISLIHPARFLFNAGATPKSWNSRMLNDPHLSVPLYEPQSQKIFSGVDIKGGVCITLWDKKQTDGGLGGNFIAFEELRSIVKKINKPSIDSIIFPQTKTSKPIDRLFPNEVRIRPNYFEKFPDIFKEQKDEENNVKIVGLTKGNKRTERYVSEILINDPNLKNWKVFLPKSNGSGALGEVVSTPLTGEPLTGEPLTGCTGSFVQFGAFESQFEAENCMKYLKTRFCRVMLGTLKVTQDNPKSTWKNVPLQDFTSGSDIDWSRSIDDIDRQLYVKYNLDQKEIDFIETNVKKMV